MSFLQRCVAVLALGAAVVGGSLSQGGTEQNDRVDAAVAALMGLVDAGSVPEPVYLQVLRLPTDRDRGELPLWGDVELTGTVLARLGGNAKSEKPSLAVCEDVGPATAATRCRFPGGTPVGIRVEALSSDRGVFVIFIIETTEDPGMPLDLTGYRVSVSRTTSGVWGSEELLTVEPAQLNWRALAIVRPDSMVGETR